ncbi:MAG TPA: DEAD/DEAH box helicase [Candidatus Saccharimonadales bacterium]|nr:DEAD/DEAH box helicase [Candidatus Saccharimonadales bacterium]
MPDVYSLFLGRFSRFTEIQELSLPVIKSGKNCIITSPTGSGKTEAALLPILEMLEKQNGSRGVFAFYITPLRALNRDLEKRLEWLCGELGISLGSRHGDTPTRERAKQAASPPHLIITTPESFQNLFLSARLREAMKSTRVVIVDELHELYHNKRGAQLAVALERLEELSGPFQRIGISATIGNMDAVSFFLFGKREHEVVAAKTRKRFEISIEMPTVPVRRHSEFEQAFSLDDGALARIERISDIINSSGATLVFANTRQVVESLGSKLVYLNRLEGVESVGIHHSSLDRQERIEIENSFKEGKLKGIIATSSLELGIDIGKIDHVVQYGSPRQAVRLIQRVGRGGHREGAVSRGHVLVSGVLEALESAASVIGAESGALEMNGVESGALDVLVNQITAIALEYRKINLVKLASIIKRASPYIDLSREAFERSLAFAADLHLLRVDSGIVSVSSRTRKYFFGNISVIPDSPRFYVKDAVRNKVISTLDDRFVYNYLDIGGTFITKGVPWKVLSIEEDTVFVEASADFESSIPDWEGEDIPVSYNIADTAMRLLGQKKVLEDRLDGDAFAVVSRFADLQSKHFLPGVGKIFYEVLEDYVVIYIPLGKLANEFLSRVIAGLVATNARDRVFVRSTPYAIIIDCRYLRRPPDMAAVFNTIANTEALKNRAFVEKSELFRYKFVQIAKLFGVIEKKAVLTKSMASRIIDFYKDSVVYEETVRDLDKNYLDAEVVGTFVEKLRKREVSLEARGGESPITKEILRSVLHYREFLSRATAGEEEIKAFEDRFKDKETMLLCTFCGFQFSHKVDLAGGGGILCPRCRSPMLATYDERYAVSVLKKLSGKKMDADAREAYNNAIRETGMISAYGDRAIVALLTYGVGLVTAARVLRMIRKDNKHFIKDLIDAQKSFVKNSKFWMKK